MFMIRYKRDGRAKDWYYAPIVCTSKRDAIARVSFMKEPYEVQIVEFTDPTVVYSRNQDNAELPRPEVGPTLHSDGGPSGG